MVGSPLRYSVPKSVNKSHRQVPFFISISSPYYHIHEWYHNIIIFEIQAHGTHIGHIRLESRKPQQVPIDSEIHFGASTRLYIIRERPQAITGQISDDNEKRREDLEGGLLGLPETETELDVNIVFSNNNNLFLKALWYKTESTFFLKKNNPQNLQAWIFLSEAVFCIMLKSID